jgi:oligopeptidase B
MSKLSTIAPPIAKKNPRTLTIHNDIRIDDYYWLNDREDENVIAYLNAENEYREQMMAHTTDLQSTLYDEIVSRIAQTDVSVPYKENGYFYYVRYEEGKEYPIYCRKKDNLDNEEEILLNGNEMAKEHAYFQIGGMAVSPDNQWLTYSIDTVSRRQYTIFVKNLNSKKILSEEIKNTTGNIAWANDAKTFFYTTKDEQTLRPNKVFRHKIKTSVAEDVFIFEETDDTFYCVTQRSKSGKFIFIASASTISTEFQFLSADKPRGKFKTIQKRAKNHEYNVEHYGDYFYILTNDKAKNFRLVRTSIDKVSKKNWEEVVAHRSDTLLEGMEFFKDYLVLSERTNGETRLCIKPWSSDAPHYIDFGEKCYTIYPSVNPEYDTETLRFGYTSLTTPNSTFDYNMKNRDMQLLKQQEVVGGYEKNNYQSERIFATAKDGTQVPISLIYNKNLDRKKPNPTLLYAYGSYGHSIDPMFSSARLSLLDRGFVFAIAHIRGGQELGRHWYEQGKMLKKKNTFTDFIACAEMLINQDFTDKNNLSIMGGSAGGLLMGVVINLRPDLFRAVVAAVPFVDVVTTMLDDSIPLTTGEYNEWGNPNEEKYYKYMKSYSPYDNVGQKKYPTMLVTTGLHDSQVQYWEPAKWVAKLRDRKKGNNPILIHCNMDTGHGGASGRFERFKEIAIEYAFLIDVLKKW